MVAALLLVSLGWLDVRWLLVLVDPLISYLANWGGLAVGVFADWVCTCALVG